MAYLYETHGISASALARTVLRALAGEAAEPAGVA